VEDRLVFGRQSEETGRLGDDPELSRHHAQVTRPADGAFTIEDLSSTNGTYVNGARVEEPVRLAPGDIVDLGATRLMVHHVPSIAAASPAVDVRAATAVADVPAEIRDAPRSAPAAPAVAAAPPAAPAPPPEPIPPIELHLVIDVERGEASIALAEGGDPVRLRLADGRWRLGTANA
jgi:pSer/pThr/pTyr-binding forkhead associated (FHA) protein